MENKKITRDYGLDIVRVISMLGIVILHINGAGGVLDCCQNQQAVGLYWTAFWVEILAYTSVDIFGLMSGYLGIYKKKTSCVRILELICIVFFYCVCITVVFKIAFPEMVIGIKGLLKGVFPQIVGRYWYITCYIPIGIFQPYINKAILSLSEKEHLRLSILIIAVFGLLQSFVIVDLFTFKQGYSFVWLLCLYIVGAYIKRVDLFRSANKIKQKSMAILLAGSVVLLVGNIFVDFVIHKNISYFVSYISPIILLMSICIIFLFRNTEIKSFSKIIATLSMVTFDVYLLHCHILIYDNFITDHVCWIADMNIAVIPFVIVACGIVILLVASIIGVVRSYIFKITKLNDLIKKVSVKLDKLLYVTGE